jgi:hypothetical protein
MEPLALEALPKHETVALPHQELASVAPSVGKGEDFGGERSELELAFDQLG